MGLLSMAGYRDTDLLGGKSVPRFMNDYEASQKKAKRLSETDRHFEQIMAEQRAINEQDRLDMLQRVQTRQEDLINQPYGEARNRRLERMREAEFQLYPKLT